MHCIQNKMTLPISDVIPGPKNDANLACIITQYQGQQLVTVNIKISKGS